MSEIEARGKIDAKAVNISDILKEKRYSIEYYQREYRWEEKHITDLLEDLTEKFLNSKKEDHYFLGSIIINKENQQRFIIDGQQRLTSLTLLLIYIYHTLKDKEALKDEIDKLIYSKGKGFNLNVETRSECMEALRHKGDFASDGEPESIKNIVECYNTIERDFLGHLAGEPNTPSDELAEALPEFAKWLIEKVYLVRITAHSGTDAYAVFETMNDRGVSLAPAEMLKGYLLTKSPKHRRKELNNIWKKRISELKSIGNGNGEDADALKAWLRSQHAQDTRKREKNAPPLDFERIGTEFHRWVSDKIEDQKIEELQFTEEDHFANFIRDDFSFYGKWYKFIRDVALKSLPPQEMKGMEAIRYNAYNNFTLQRTVLLAPLKKTDNDNDIRRKLRIVSSYLDILIARRIWNYKSTAYSTMQYTMFSLIRDIRRTDIEVLIKILIDKYLDKMQETFDSQKTFGLRRNTPRVRYLLARMTDYVQTQSRGESRYHEYITHEVEHIWAKKKYKEHGYDDEHEYLEHRNRIGGLLLLPKGVNTSLGEKPYEKPYKDKSLKEKPDDKLSVYVEQSDNPLAYSLHERAYKPGVGKSGFQQFIERSKMKFEFGGVRFEPYPTKFEREELGKRQALYRELCKQIWNPEKLRNM